jgi:hypothetical protein
MLDGLRRTPREHGVLGRGQRDDEHLQTCTLKLDENGQATSRETICWKTAPDSSTGGYENHTSGGDENPPGGYDNQAPGYENPAPGDDGSYNCPPVEGRCMWAPTIQRVWMETGMVSAASKERFAA